MRTWACASTPVPLVYLKRFSYDLSLHLLDSKNLPNPLLELLLFKYLVSGVIPSNSFMVVLDTLIVHKCTPSEYTPLPVYSYHNSFHPHDFVLHNIDVRIIGC